jgi:prolyl oligopeptidase
MRKTLVLVLPIWAACGGTTRAPAPAAPPAPAPAAEAPAAPAPPARAYAYPPARRGDTVDDYHGTKVADPYRWLEDADSQETRAWVEAENQLTRAFFEKSPWQARFKDRITRLYDYERYSVPFKEGGRYFYLHNTGLQNQSVLFVLDKLDGKPRELLDPNGLSKDGTIALASTAFTHDGKLMAWATGEAGSDWEEWHVKRTDTGADLPDLLKWSKFGGAAWTHDGKGFFYSAYDKPEAGKELTAANYFQKLKYHRLGTPQEKDEIVYERPDDKELESSATVTDDGRWLVITVDHGTDPRNLLYVKDLTKKNAALVTIADKLENDITFVGNLGSVFYLQTDRDAPRGRIVSVDVAQKAPAWKEVVPQAAGSLKETTLVGKTLIASYLEDAHSAVRLFAPNGKKIKDLELPGIGTASGFGGHIGDGETFYSYESLISPETIYRLDLKKLDSAIFRQPKVEFDSSAYETALVFAKSKDGTRLPLFLAHKKGLKLDGTNPTFLYGYGGFDVSMAPDFSVTVAAWLAEGGVYAHAILRGGGEYGEEWHKAGMLDKKQNVFDDFIADAEFLVADKITSPAHLAIGGGSNGGLLIGAVENQRPDLFAATVPQVGVMDMLRYHKFTIGWGWSPEYGTSDDASQWKTLYAYSPLHNIKPGTKYPATLVTTGDHDDRVVPGHSFKYAATLQAAQAGDAPILIRIETRAGHGHGKPTTKIIEEAADRLAFMAQMTGLQPAGR